MAWIAPPIDSFFSPTEAMDMDFLHINRRLVVKVKYGDTLRRFGAHVNGYIMDHGMAKLKAKIINLFKFSPDAELSLTYIDEDGDIITLNDDYELYDATIGQYLHPLRINVVLKSPATVKSKVKSKPAGSTSTSSPQIQVQQHQISYLVNEALKSVLDQVHGTPLNISNDFAKAVSSPLFLEFLENFLKLGLSNVSQSSQGESSGAATCTVDLNVCDESFIANNPIPAPTNDPIPAPTKLPFVMDNKVEIEKRFNSHQAKKAVAGSATDDDSEHSEALISYAPPSGHTDAYRSEQVPSMKPYMSQVAFNSPGGVPWQVNTSQPDVSISSGFVHSVHPYGKVRSYHDNMVHTFHKGVQCDGCGMRPITGPRFNSMKEDYDLCGFCFTEIGNDTEYTRIDGTPYRSQLHEEFYDHHPRRRFSSPHGSHGCWMGPSELKFESCFIKDITVSDGTVLPPSTLFTKVWRMGNNGTMAWPCGTQLVWIGGDLLASRDTVELEIPVRGCAVDEEVDIAVDFTSPSRPGRYISYWRMASPSGQKFGQRVWVIIQVENSRPNSTRNFHPDINLNLPPEGEGQTRDRIIDINTEPLDCLTETTQQFVKPAKEVPAQVEEPASLNVLLGANGGATHSMPAVDSSTLYPIVDFPESFFTPHVAIGTPAHALAPASDDYPVEDEDTLLMELEEMGFKQIDLNKEILQQNGYDLEQAVDDLCGFSELDDISSD